MPPTSVLLALPIVLAIHVQLSLQKGGILSKGRRIKKALTDLEDFLYFFECTNRKFHSIFISNCTSTTDTDTNAEANTEANADADANAVRVFLVFTKL